MKIDPLVGKLTADELRWLFADTIKEHSKCECVNVLEDRTLADHLADVIVETLEE